jgi:hypothetical protein
MAAQKRSCITGITSASLDLAGFDLGAAAKVGTPRFYGANATRI